MAVCERSLEILTMDFLWNIPKPSAPIHDRRLSLVDQMRFELLATKSTNLLFEV